MAETCSERFGTGPFLVASFDKAIEAAMYHLMLPALAAETAEDRWDRARQIVPRLRLRRTCVPGDPVAWGKDLIGSSR